MVNDLKINKLLLLCLIAASLIFIRQPGLEADELFQTFKLENGIGVRLYTSEAIIEGLTERDERGGLIMHVPGGGSYMLIEDVSDPVIGHMGDGSFHPMSADMVLRSVEEIDVNGAVMDIDVEIYILPYPRYGFLGSSSCGNRIYLSPGVYEFNRYGLAYIVTHEIGHVFQHRYVPDDDSDGWHTYLNLRGIYGDPEYSGTSCHMKRPKEIFAEDFRYLFGGEDSRYSGTIENPNIPPPDEIDGLTEFFYSLLEEELAIKPEVSQPDGREILSASNYPNPFNPETTIHAAFNSSSTHGTRYVDLVIYGADGSVVRRLYRGPVSGEEFEISWDGRNETGCKAASGIYFYRISSGNDDMTGKMLLVR